MTSFPASDLPGATRAHHMLNLAPFTQLLVAAQLVHWGRRDRLRRGVAAAAGVALIASGAFSIGATQLGESVPARAEMTPLDLVPGSSIPTC